jgi:hypothetical protein
MKKPDKRNIESILGLTPIQEEMLFHYLKDTGSEQYFEQLSLEISGEINVDLFEKSTVERIAENYIEILEQLEGYKNIKLREIKITHELLSGKSVLRQEDALDFTF